MDLSAKDVGKWIEDLFAGSEAKVDVLVRDSNTVVVDLEDYFYDEGAKAIDTLHKEVESKGWYVASDSTEEAEDEATIWLHSVAAAEVPVPRFVYHVTSRSRLPKVLQMGILQSRGGARHGVRYPARVFVARDKSILDDMDLYLKDPVVLRIDTTKVPGLKLHVDPQYPLEDEDDPSAWESAYTEAKIPPEALSLEEDAVQETLLRRFVRSVARQNIRS